jgi:hypothetical protein
MALFSGVLVFHPDTQIGFTTEVDDLHDSMAFGGLRAGRSPPRAAAVKTLSAPATST